MKLRFLLVIICFLLINQGKSQSIVTKVESALIKMSEGQFKDSFKELKKIASSNNVIAQFYVAQCYEHGIGTEKDLPQAFFMYRKAAERGLPQGMQELIRCYQKGIGVLPNKEKAFDWQKRFEAKHNITEIPNIIEIFNNAESNLPLMANNDDNKNLFNDDSSSSQIIPSNQNLSNSENINKTIHPEKQVTTVSQESIVKISDVDVNIPTTNQINNNTFAFIIAIENYRNVASVPHSINDGKILALYCNNTLGIPKENISIAIDATFGEMRRLLNRMEDIANAYKGNASFIFYYAGHGFPNEKTHDGFIVPADGDPKDLVTCFSLEDIYTKLGALQSKKVITIFDACFSGSQRGNGMLASARGIAIKTNKCEPKGNVVALTSAQGDETAYPYDEQNHGIFTYYLLKFIQEHKKSISLGELSEYLTDNVSKKSIIINGKPQTPSVIPSKDINDDWYNWKLD